MPLSRINSASIANSAIIAADIADGTITAVKIISVANTQITGNIVSSQITSVGGSQITANTIANSAFQTGSVENYMNSQNLGFGMRNRIINGAMVIDQRNAGANVTVTADVYTADRWIAQQTAASKYSVQQNAGAVTPPSGFTNYLGATSLSAYSVAAGDYFMLRQGVEGFNFADMAWGTANAKTVTLSALVYSSLTGTFGGALQNNVENRSYPFTYSIPVANTWTQISITVTGDTSGAWLTTNGQGLRLIFSLGMGSTYSGTSGAWAGANYKSATGAVSVVGTSGATFYITGVQLEKGSTATSFDFRSYGTELALCQRYYWQSASQSAVGSASSIPSDAVMWQGSTGGLNYDCTANICFPVDMRISPNVTRTNIFAFTFPTTLQASITSPRAYSETRRATGAANGAFGTAVIASAEF